MAEKEIKAKKPAVKSAVKKKTTETVSAAAPVATKPVAPVRAARKQAANLTVDMYDAAGKVTGSVSLPEEVFGAKINKRLIAQAVRIYLANQREGSASTKSRGEVQGSTRKIYRQKGTGRARHGGVRAPIFVHGGIAHGPKPRDFSLKMPQKMKRAALFATLSLKAQTNAVRVIENEGHGSIT
jgi:large subunit ribosomal protein L4